MTYVFIGLGALALLFAVAVPWVKRSNELWRGYNRSLEIIQNRCPFCDGWGYYGVAFQGPKCQECGGTGTLTREQRDALSSRAQQVHPGPGAES